MTATCVHALVAQKFPHLFMFQTLHFKYYYVHLANDVETCLKYTQWLLHVNLTFSYKTKSFIVHQTLDRDNKL